MGMQLADTYIGRRQAKVAHWVALLPLLELCARKIAMRGEVGIIGHGGYRGNIGSD